MMEYSEDVTSSSANFDATIKKKEGRTKTAKLKAALQRALTTQEALKSRLRLIQFEREGEEGSQGCSSLEQTFGDDEIGHEKVSKEAARKQMEIDTA